MKSNVFLWLLLLMLGAGTANGQNADSANSNDSTLTIYQLRSAAEQGDAVAQFELGRCYCVGDGVEQDFKKAFEWWMKADEEGNADARKALMLTEEANGLFVDLEKKIDVERKMIVSEE